MIGARKVVDEMLAVREQAGDFGEIVYGAPQTF
jgi:hypothetical protein